MTAAGAIAFRRRPYCSPLLNYSHKKLLHYCYNYGQTFLNNNTPCVKYPKLTRGHFTDFIWTSYKYEITKLHNII
ncbi:unnamed protein product [Leptidea sinapis]|uniref:Uncharacterized protein n=1 Tax=Leptidea sinapis TaxID=189913 RepID=A0A5E4Q0R2_9NEOP|nr:unnamed protein product [Leptidea sinapis]